MPRGGGAIQGIGEKFATSAATGTGSFSVPITTSPGRDGFALGLQLTYDSGRGNGPFGLGFGLSSPAISRKTDKGLPRYADAESSDVFVVSGAEDLVPVRIPDGSGTRLDVVDRGNVVRYRYKAEDAAGVDAGRASEANRFVRAPDGTTRFVATAQRYPKRIQYGNRAPVARDQPASSNDADWLFEVVFDYGEHDAAAPAPAEVTIWPVRPDHSRATVPPSRSGPTGGASAC